MGGEQNLAFDVIKGEMTVLAGGVSVGVLVEAVRKTGMSARLLSAPVEARSWWSLHGRLTLTIASGALTLAGLLTHLGLTGNWAEALSGVGNAPPASRVLYGLAILAGLYLVLPKALYSLRRVRPDMNLLMTIAAVGAVAIGEWFEGATVAFLFALSLTLEAWSVGRARRAIERLLDLAPTVVRVLDASGVREMAPALVEVGTRFQVRPGERIALDGEIVSGVSEVNQAPITGESVSVLKEAGAPVFAGTVNGAGMLEVRATRTSDDTTLAHIIRMVGEAQRNRAPAEQWVDGFARRYTPAVLLIALAVLLIPTLVLGQAFAPWVYQSLVLLVIACPCALVISTPVSVVAALAAAARRGVLVKGGAHMETPARLKAIAFDKTGTLSVGHPAVVRAYAMNGHTETELLERAVAMESHSDHPLAKAIVAYGAAMGVRPLPADEFSITPGKGATAKWNGKEYWLGSHRFLEERGQETPEVHEQLEALSATGQTVVVVGTEAHVCGFLALRDVIRPEAAAVVAELRTLGIQHVVMLSGDNQGTADAIGREAGIDEIHGDLLPSDKLATVGELVERYGAVAMVGDGINDAPALSRATVGIAMGAAGSDTAMEAADIALMSDDLSKLPWLIRHSRRMVGIIRANIVMSLAVKAVFVGLTMWGHASLWAAIAADMGVSLLVIFNALRLLRG